MDTARTCHACVFWCVASHTAPVGIVPGLTGITPFFFFCTLDFENARYVWQLSWICVLSKSNCKPRLRVVPRMPGW